MHLKDTDPILPVGEYVVSIASIKQDQQTFVLTFFIESEHRQNMQQVNRQRRYRWKTEINSLTRIIACAIPIKIRYVSEPLIRRALEEPELLKNKHLYLSVQHRYNYPFTQYEWAPLNREY